MFWLSLFRPESVIVIVIVIDTTLSLLLSMLLKFTETINTLLFNTRRRIIHGVTSGATVAYVYTVRFCKFYFAW